MFLLSSVTDHKTYEVTFEDDFQILVAFCFSRISCMVEFDTHDKQTL